MKKTDDCDRCIDCEHYYNCDDAECDLSEEEWGEIGRDIRDQEYFDEERNYF